MLTSAAPWAWSLSTWAGLQFLVLLVAAIVAWRQVREARRLREAQARPFVVVDLDIFSTIAQLKLTNIGSTLAQEVRFDFAPALVSTLDNNQSGTPISETRLLKDGVPSLPPHKEIFVLFDQLPARIERDLPSDYEVRVRYRDPFGRRYDERMTVGYGALIGTGKINRKELDDIHRQLEAIAKTMSSWTRLNSALKVMSPADLKAYNEELLAEREARRTAAQERSAEPVASDGTDDTPPTDETAT